MDFLKQLADTQQKLDQIEEARDIYLARRAESMVSARNDGASVATIAETTKLSQVRVYQILQGR
jgi:hypothetical protein